MNKLWKLLWEMVIYWIIHYLIVFPFSPFFILLSTLVRYILASKFYFIRPCADTFVEVYSFRHTPVWCVCCHVWLSATPWDYSPSARLLRPRTLQARTLEGVAISSSRRISPTQGSNPRLLRLLHWQLDSLPLCHLGTFFEQFCRKGEAVSSPHEDRKVTWSRSVVSSSLWLHRL